jgi:hypothetical protein
MLAWARSGLDDYQYRTQMSRVRFGFGRVTTVPGSTSPACTNGQPGAATMLLLRALRAAGARLVHHGDFDWAGIRIGNVLHRQLSVEPWRFDTEAYLTA